MMKHLAITGNIGSGKSTACRFFETLGIPVYYSDARAKKLMVENAEVVDDIKQLLGEGAYAQNGHLERSYVASKIFSNRALLDQMNQIVHPAVREDYLAWRDEQNSLFTLQESALTFEIGGESIMDKVILVYAPEELLIERSMQRDGATIEAVRSRLDQQMSQDLKAERADFILYNGLTDSLLFQVLDIFSRMVDNSTITAD